MTSKSTITVITEPSRALPLVDGQIILRQGALIDPKGVEGLTWATARVLRMGTGKLTQRDVDERFAELGAHVSVEVAHSYVRYSFSTLARNLDKVLDLLAELLLKPAFRARDLKQVQREAAASLEQRRENDRTLAQLHFRHFVYGTHPAGAVVTPASIKRWSIDKLKAWHARTYQPSAVIIGMAGDYHDKSVARLATRLDALTRNYKAPAALLHAPQIKPGCRLRIVDKPARTQTQILMGTLGITYTDPRYFPLTLANTVFGGTFTSRLTQAVRADRGWSYNAVSSLGVDRYPDLWSMWTFPASKDAAACVELERQLFATWVKQGITAKELSFAKKALVRSFAFEQDTPVKRLQLKCEQEIFNLPRDFYPRYTERLAEPSLKDVNEALRKSFSPNDLHIVVVGTANELKTKLKKLPKLGALDVVDFQSL